MRRRTSCHRRDADASSGRCRCCGDSRSIRARQARPLARPPTNSRSTTCAAALDAYRARLPRLVEVVKAIAVAELEATGAYVEADHDAFFERYDEHALTADDLALFPDYLVCIPRGHNDAPENAGLIDMLSAGLPVKVLVQHTDLLEEASIGTGHFAFGVRSARLATTAMGLGGMFVLQSTSADLYRAARARAARPVVSRPGAVLASSPARRRLPPICRRTSRRRRRRSRGRSRPSATTPRPARTGRRVSRWNTIAIPMPTGRSKRSSTPTRRCSACRSKSHSPMPTSCCATGATARTSPSCRASAGTTTCCRWPTGWHLPERGVSDRVPYLWAVDADDRLHRVIVDARLMQATRRCLLLWHRLQEHARHQRLARRAAAGARAGCVGGAKAAGDRGTAQSHRGRHTGPVSSGTGRRGGGRGRGAGNRD